MQNSRLVLSEYEEINSPLYKPIITTQRIKYTCINVSTNYIVLGSTSGSLYLFKKNLCIFQQLIPLSEGNVTRVLISPDEKSIAASTKRGSVCVIGLKPTIKLLSVSNEHFGQVVTSLCWNDKSTEIYVGDEHGKISTIVLSIFTVNGMFQAPSCALMQLDSRIVQTDYTSHYLLVSTLTRCYICDTSQEQFKQIGNKARDGDFGACFLNLSNDENQNSNQYQEGKKQMNTFVHSDSIIDSNNDNTVDKNIIIFCARPGYRLWEVTINGFVVKTHQFKNALALAPTKIFQSSDIKTLNINEQNEQILSTQILNFEKLYVLKRKYLISFNSTGLYIIDTVNAAVILWTDQLKNISTAITIDDKIYLMKTTGTFHCLVLSTVENLILKLYEAKLYYDCFNVCMTFRSDLLELNQSNLNNDDKIVALPEQKNNITSILEPVILFIQSNFIESPKRLDSGIVVVNFGNSKLTSRGSEELIDHKKFISKNETMEDDYSEKIVENESLKINETNSEENIIKQEKNKSSEAFLKAELLKNNYDESASTIELLTTKFQVDCHPIYETIDSLKSTMTEIELEKVVLRVSEIISNVNLKYKTKYDVDKNLYEITKSIEKHYFHVLLTNISCDILKVCTKNCILVEFLKAYIDLNLSKSFVCFCGYKIEDDSEPIFLTIGCALLLRLSNESTDKCIELCKIVPYMWQYYLPIYMNKGFKLDDIIQLCLNTKNNIVISILIPHMNSKQWKIFADCHEKMERKDFFECNNDINTYLNNQNNAIDWSGIIHEIIKRKGTEKAMTFLSLIETYLPKIKIKKSTFQSLMFSKLLNNYGLDKAIDLDENKFFNKYNSICFSKTREKLVDALKKDLEIPINGNIFGSGAYHWGIIYEKKTATCPCCSLFLHTPVLLENSGISIFPCGHAFHVNCLIQKKIIQCYLHF